MCTRFFMNEICRAQLRGENYMDVRVIIELGDLPKKQLLECYPDILSMAEEFSKKHPDISIPSNAVRVEGSLLGFNFGKGVF